MKRGIVAIWISLAMLFSFVIIVIEMPTPVKAGTIWVDDDYGSEDPTHKKTIWSAIENASNGDTIIVYNGEYEGGEGGVIYIDKSVEIIGESIENTIINNTPVSFTSNNINFSYFKFQHCMVGTYNNNVKLNYCNFTSLSGLDVHSSSSYIWLSNSSILERGWLCTHGASYVYIDNVYMNNTQCPLWITSSSKIFITNSILTYLDNWGLYLEKSTNIVMKNTTIISDEGGIDISWGSMSEPEYYNHSIDTTNTVNGKPVHYYYNKTSLTLKNLDAGHITFALCSNITLEDSNVTGGDGINLVYSSNINVSKNDVLYNLRRGINLINSAHNNLFKDNFLSNNKYGISLYQSTENRIINNTISFSEFNGITIASGSINNSVLNCNVTYNKWGIAIRGSENMICNNFFQNNDDGVWLISSESSNNIFINNTLLNDNREFYFKQGANAITLNTTFNKTRTSFEAFWEADDYLIVQWYLHVKVIDYIGNPVSNANIKIEDNINGSYNQTFVTDSNGYIKWIPVTEYIERDENTDWIGEKTYYTPHKIVAWNDTLIGYAQPIMNESKTVTIVLQNGTLSNLESGWNLISLPRLQSDSNLRTILQSIEEQYDAVRYYNTTDLNDPWKHYHVLKPSSLNDLNEINHTMGLWVHITDPGGTTLVVKGDVLSFNQSITLLPGWNLVGYPSLRNRTRDNA